MKKKGFTLVELLAVIVILAIIALIAIPLIGNVIEKAKIGALESSVNGLVESANMYYANNTIKGETISETIFDFEDGEQVSDKKLEYKGKVYNGKLILHANGEVAVCIDDKEHYAYKNKNTDEVISGTGTCLYDGTTGDFSSNSLINDLRGKTLVATNISQSQDGLSTLIKIPEEGHYNENSIISVPIENIKTEVDLGASNMNILNAVPQNVSYYNASEYGTEQGKAIGLSSGTKVADQTTYSDYADIALTNNWKIKDDDQLFVYGQYGASGGQGYRLGFVDSNNEYHELYGDFTSGGLTNSYKLFIPLNSYVGMTITKIRVYVFPINAEVWVKLTELRLCSKFD